MKVLMNNAMSHGRHMTALGHGAGMIKGTVCADHEAVDIPACLTTVHVSSHAVLVDLVMFG